MRTRMRRAKSWRYAGRRRESWARWPRRGGARIAQQFIAGMGGVVESESPVGTIEPCFQQKRGSHIQPSLRDWVSLSAFCPSNELLGYSRVPPPGRSCRRVGPTVASRAVYP